MWKEGYGPAPEEVILTVEISVPHNKMHYIVNEDRSLTTEMEKEMGCIIRLPIEETSNNTNYSSLHIIGGFIGTQVSLKFLFLYSQINMKFSNINNNISIILLF